ncbi:substrate-binding domain-containing protein [Micromonospora sp. CB01531]|uniref:substrate-binding domain-containing protein n=1 Tax=Micromonospora sp. CB01531 TaxID=1718947 RepID=UPI001300E661|nr:substrate-binding domain-containing protein [Micromonospora sp. CB01531]
MANFASGITRRNFVRGAAGVASLAAMGGLAACSGGAGTEGGPQPVRTGPGPGGYRIDLGGYQGPELTDKPVVLRFLRQSYSDEVNALFASHYATFSKAYPNIKIEEELIPYGNLPQKIQIYTQSGDAPDIMMSRLDFTEYMSRSGQALNLTDYLTQAFLSDLFTPMREAGSSGGRLYLMPWEGYLPMVLFNREIFKRAGVPTPPEVDKLDDGWTVEQMFETMNALTHNLRKKGDTATWALESSILGNGGPGSNYTQYESIWIRNMGDRSAEKGSSLHSTWQGVSDNGLTVSGYLDTDEAIQGMRNYQRLFSEGLTPKSAIPAQFQGAQAAMSMNSIRQILNRDKPGGASPFDVGVTLDPRRNMLFGCNSGDAPFVWAKSKHPNEAAALLAYLCSDACQAPFFRSRGAFITRRSLVEKLEEYQKPDEQLALKVADNCDGAPRTVGWNEYYAAINPAVKDIALGADPEKTLRGTAKHIDDQLKKYHR